MEKLVWVETPLISEIITFLNTHKQTHRYCDDGWYTCPKHPDGCLNSAEGTECDCGADAYNAEVDIIKQELEQVLR